MLSVIYIFLKNNNNCVSSVAWCLLETVTWSVLSGCAYRLPPCLSYASAPSWGCMADPSASSGHTQKHAKAHSSDPQPATVTHWPTLVQQTHAQTSFIKAHITDNKKLSVTLSTHDTNVTFCHSLQNN